MIAEKTGADVPPTSFADARNADVQSVQFVITTPAVRIVSKETGIAAEEESTGILQKIRDLFK